MSFKVVATKERGSILFTAVPKNWENDNMLMWPENIRHSEREVLRSNCNSVPDISWSSYDCIVKVADVNSFEEALRIEKMLSKCVDSDAEEFSFSNYLKRKKKLKNNNVVPDRNIFVDKGFSIISNKSNANIDDNIIIENDTTAVENNGLAFINNEAFIENESSFNENNIASEELVSQNYRNSENNSSYVILSTNEIPNTITTNSSKENTIYHIQRIEERLEKIEKDVEFTKKELVKTNVYLDKIYQLLRNSNQENNSAVTKNAGDENNIFKNLPLRTCEEINLFEANINKDKEFKTILIHELSKIGGTSGEQIDSQILYKVVDFVFTKEVLVFIRGQEYQEKKDKRKSLSTLFMEF